MINAFSSKISRQFTKLFFFCENLISLDLLGLKSSVRPLLHDFTPQMLPRRYATCHGIQPYRTSYIITLWLLSQNNEAVCYCQPIATEFSLAIFQQFWCHAKLFNHIQLNAIRFSRFAHLFESHKWCEFGQSCTNKSWLKKYRVFRFWSWMLRGDHLKIRIGCFWIFLGFSLFLRFFFFFSKLFRLFHVFLFFRLLRLF